VTGPLEEYYFYGVDGEENNWFVCASGGNLLRGDGSSWTVAGGLGATTNYLYGLWAQGDEAIAVGASGTAVHFDGSNQLLMTTGTSEYLRAVWGTSSSNVYAVGDDGVIIHYDGNTSRLWTVMESGVSENIDLEGIWGTSNNNIYAVGDDGVIVHYNGSSWSRVWTDSYTDFRAIHGSSASNIYVVGSSNVYFYDGKGWRQVQQNASWESLYDVHVLGVGDLFAVGCCASILYLDER
jgi:hypothetical protein